MRPPMCGLLCSTLLAVLSRTVSSGVCDTTALLQADVSVHQSVSKTRMTQGHQDVNPGALSYLDIERLPDTIMAAKRLTVNNTLPVIAESEDPAELSFMDLSKMPDQLASATLDRAFMASVAEASKKLPMSSERYVKATRKLTDSLGAESAARDPAALLADVFDKHLELMTKHRAEATELGEKIRGSVPKDLAKALNPWLDGMLENIAIEGVDQLRLTAQRGKADSCGAIEPVMSAYSLQHSRIKQMLDATARGWYPQIKNWGDWRKHYDSAAVPAFGVALSKQFQLDSGSSVLLYDTVNLCYTEMIALEQASHLLMLEVTPLLKQLHCTWSSGAGGQSATLAGALALAASATSALLP